MTTLNNVKRKCTICNNTSEHTTYGSYTVRGSVDLDTRPPEMLRNLLRMWIQTYPHYGYCAFDISKSIVNAEEIVKSDDYKMQLKDDQFSDKANAFLCHSRIQSNVNEFVASGRACMYAAWICDDKNELDAAIICRKEAIVLFQKALQQKQEFAEPSGGQDCLIVDLMRRSNQFEEAIILLRAYHYNYQSNNLLRNNMLEPL